ncbi:hypothetical protein TNCV_2463781 [Trichonephila clavipes]|nr:hypothetical protein TNCV_2463781 [Trichonephila clavipes]
MALTAEWSRSWTGGRRVRSSSPSAIEGRGSRVWDRCWPCREFEPSTTKDPPPCRTAMHVDSVESSNASSRWCDS